MTAYLATLALVDRVFLGAALLGALCILIATVWMVIAGGFNRKDADEPAEVRTQGHLGRIYPGIFGFLMMFGVVGLALRRLADAAPLWAVLGALVAGVMLVGVFAAGNSKDNAGSGGRKSGIK